MSLNGKKAHERRDVDGLFGRRPDRKFEMDR
jgi:hypothetical protein